MATSQNPNTPRRRPQVGDRSGTGEPTLPVWGSAPQPAPHNQAATLPREVDDPEIDAALDAVVAGAPPLPFEVRARLAWLLRGGHQDARRDRAA